MNDPCDKWLCDLVLGMFAPTIRGVPIAIFAVVTRSAIYRQVNAGSAATPRTQAREVDDGEKQHRRSHRRWLRAAAESLAIRGRLTTVYVETSCGSDNK